MPSKKTIQSNLNAAAIELFDEMLSNSDVLKAKVLETKLGPIIIDFGIKAKGGYLAGEYITQLCLGGIGDVSITITKFADDFSLPSISVITDFPAEATLGSQFAGWSIDKDNYKAMGSGPARILARKPKHIFEKIPLVEETEEAVIVLETDKYPTDKVLKYIADKCHIELDCLYVVIAPTTSIAGTTQISGRSIETALHKLFDLGMDVSQIISASGTAPIAPIHQTNSDLMMGRTNDMLIYGAEVFLQVECKDEDKLIEYLEKATSESSPKYGTSFYEIVKEAKGDFYKIDPAIFAPAKLNVNNISTGKTHSFGKINSEMLKKSIHSQF
ncbi:MAG: methenyltetrahydromethanopterin cyclohydrolase [Candidatus Heimdallarchaeota archaeon]